MFPDPTCGADEPLLSVPPPEPPFPAGRQAGPPGDPPPPPVDVIVENTEFDPLPDTPVLGLSAAPAPTVIG